MVFKIQKKAPQWWDDYVKMPQQSSFQARLSKKYRFFIEDKKKKGLLFTIKKQKIWNIARVAFPNEDEELIKAFDNYCKKNKLTSLILSFRNYPFLHKQDVATVQVDLEEDNWKELDKKTRNQVRKSEKNGVSVKPAENLDDYKKFYKILEDTSERKSFDIPSFENIKNLTEKKEFCKIFLAYLNNKVVSGSLVTFFKDRINLNLAGTYPEHYRDYPTNLIYWKIIEFGKENNFKIFDLGGYTLNAKKNSPKYGINKFKLGYGDVKKYYFLSNSFYYIFLRKIYSKFQK